MSYYQAGMDLMQEIWDNWSPEDKEWFQNENPHLMHHSLGRHLRNHCGMWKSEWVPKIIDGVDHSDQHPDAISMRVILDFQTKVLMNNESNQTR